MTLWTQIPTFTIWIYLKRYLAKAMGGMGYSVNYGMYSVCILYDQ